MITRNTMSERPLSFWGWGFADRFPDLSARRSLARRLRLLLAFRTGKPREPPRLEQVVLPPPRLAPSAGLAEDMLFVAHFA